MIFYKRPEGLAFGKWPKEPPLLSDAEKSAREAYMRVWHEELPSKYGQVEKFNHELPALAVGGKKIRTLEIGAGLGEHLTYEDLSRQEYYALEFRQSFCQTIEKRFPHVRVVQGDIHCRQPWDDHFFDRIIAIHVLEHLIDLPRALDEVDRLLKPTGIFDVVIPCEGRFAHSLGRKLTAERTFRRLSSLSFERICLNEHVNTYDEIAALLAQRYEKVSQTFFPLRVPVPALNFVAKFRFRSPLAGPGAARYF